MRKNQTFLFVVLTLFMLTGILSVNALHISNNDLLSPSVVNISLNNPIQHRLNNMPIKKVVIDAGHGGKDGGCSGSYSKEKHIALAIALELGRRINYYHPEIEVIYTREEDVFIPLFKRIDMANKSGADLFISVHCNAVSAPSIHGTETYVMGLHTSDENLTVAKRENASILMEKDFRQNYDGYDPYSPEGHALLSLIQSTHLEQSIQFASFIEKSFAKRTKMKSRGVKQAGFVVLRQATMPSVLVETGFLTNLKDQGVLSNRVGQMKVADAIVKAFTEYVRYREEASKLIVPLVTITEVGDTPKKVDPELDMSNHDLLDDPVPSSTTIADKTPESVFEIQSRKPEPIVYKVQIAASRNKTLNTNSAQWKGLTNIEVNQEKNLYKYLTGQHKNMQSAVEHKKELREMGFKGAFVVAYRGNQRVKL